MCNNNLQAARVWKTHLISAKTQWLKILIKYQDVHIHTKESNKDINLPKKNLFSTDFFFLQIQSKLNIKISFHTKETDSISNILKKMAWIDILLPKAIFCIAIKLCCNPRLKCNQSNRA